MTQALNSTHVPDPETVVASHHIFAIVRHGIPAKNLN
jgi:hypothetical protein